MKVHYLLTQDQTEWSWSHL